MKVKGPKASDSKRVQANAVAYRIMVATPMPVWRREGSIVTWQGNKTICLPAWQDPSVTDQFVFFDGKAGVCASFFGRSCFRHS